MLIVENLDEFALLRDRIIYECNKTNMETNVKYSKINVMVKNVNCIHVVNVHHSKYFKVHEMIHDYLK